MRPVIYGFVSYPFQIFLEIPPAEGGATYSPLERGEKGGLNKGFKSHADFFI